MSLVWTTSISRANHSPRVLLWRARHAEPGTEKLAKIVRNEKVRIHGPYTIQTAEQNLAE
jgi:hypothetical protein